MKIIFFIFNVNDYVKNYGRVYLACEFRYGVSDRGASIRIPMATANAGCGYLEDRRPAANMDPYEVCAAIIQTVCVNNI